MILGFGILGLGLGSGILGFGILGLGLGFGNLGPGPGLAQLGLALGWAGSGLGWLRFAFAPILIYIKPLRSALGVAWPGLANS